MFLKVFNFLCELLACFCMHVFGASNYVPYVPTFFLIWSRTSHNELRLKLFCGLKTKNSTSNELRMKLSTIVEKLVIENEYDARTYEPIILREYFSRRRLQSFMVWNGLKTRFIQA
jgi:hypothetical protein